MSCVSSKSIAHLPLRCISGSNMFLFFSFLKAILISNCAVSAAALQALVRQHRSMPKTHEEYPPLRRFKMGSSLYNLSYGQNLLTDLRSSSIAASAHTGSLHHLQKNGHHGDQLLQESLAQVLLHCSRCC